MIGSEYSCWLPFLALRKYTVWPSADSEAELTFQPAGVICFGGAASRVRRLRANRAVLALRLASVLRLANTTVPPSAVSTGAETRSMATMSRTSRPRAAATLGRAASRLSGNRA
ncbi:hypothetical protein D3C73_1471480 [compost metagenome]